MKTILRLVLAFSSSSVLLGAVYMLRPKGNTEKSIKLVFSVIFLSVIVMGFRGANGAEINFTVANSQDKIIAVSSNVTKTQAEYLTTQILKQNGYDFNKISVITDIAEDNSIFIKRITVFTNNSDAGIKQSILSAINACEVEVINE